MSRNRTLLTIESVPSLPPHVKLHHDQVRQRWVLLAPERLLEPDDTALEILHLCDGKNAIQDIAKSMTKQYNAPEEQITADIIVMLQDLVDKNFLKATDE